ncbi:MAG: VOC family protein [Solirubrobacterales bacterium]|nr:VOC family protein [Solirubrobacterales bacterium]
MSATPSASAARSPLSPAIAGLAELTLETDDPEGLARFYAEVLGLKVISSQPDRVWLALSHDTRLGLWSPGGKEFGDRGGSHVHFAFAARRIGLPMLAERIRAARIEVTGPVAHPGGDCSIYFQDPAGNVVEAWDYLDRPRGRREGVRALE